MQLTRIPHLEQTMRAKHATIEALAKVAGVCKSTVESARKGQQVLESSAEAIREAINTHTFSYKIEARKNGKTFLLPQHPNANSTKVKPAYCNKLNFEDDPDKIFKTHGKISQTSFPIHKSEAEIERMWEYNRLMGRR